MPGFFQRGILRMRFQLFGGEPRASPEGLDLAIVELARHPIDHANRAQGVARGREHWSSGIEANVGFAGDKRIVAESLVQMSVAHQQNLSGMKNRVRAKGYVPGRLPSRQADARLEPLAVRIYQAEQGDRRLASLACQEYDVVERLLGLGVKDGALEQCFEARAFIGWLCKSS